MTRPSRGSMCAEALYRAMDMTVSPTDLER